MDFVIHKFSLTCLEQWTRVEQFVFDEQHRIFIGDGGLQQLTGVAEGVGGDDAQFRHTQEHLFERLAVGRPVAAPPAHRRANDERHAHLIIVHPAKFGRVVDDLVGNQGDEIAKHDLDHRTQTAQRHAGGHANDSRLGNGCGQDAFGEYRT